MDNSKKSPYEIDDRMKAELRKSFQEPRVALGLVYQVNRLVLLLSQIAAYDFLLEEDKVYADFIASLGVDMKLLKEVALKAKSDGLIFPDKPGQQILDEATAFLRSKGKLLEEDKAVDPLLGAILQRGKPSGEGLN